MPDSVVITERMACDLRRRFARQIHSWRRVPPINVSNRTILVYSRYFEKLLGQCMWELDIIVI